MLHNLSFRIKMLVLILPSIIIGLVALSSIIYYQIYTTIEAEMYTNMQSKTGETAANINLWLKAKLVDMELYASSPSMLDVNSDPQPVAQMNSNRLDKMLKLFPEERPVNVYTAGLDGKAYVASVNDGRVVLSTIDITNMEYYQKIMSGTSGYIKAVQYSLAAKRVVIGPCAPIIKDGNVVGVTGASFSTEIVAQKIDDLTFGAKGYSILLSEDGTYIEHPDRSKVGIKENSSTMPQGIIKMSDEPDEELQTLCGKVLAEEHGAFQFTQNGKRKVAFYHRIPVTGWSAISIVDEEELFAPAKRLLYMMCMISLLMIVILSLIIYYTSIRLSRPLQQLSAFANHLCSIGIDSAMDSKTDISLAKIKNSIFQSAPLELKKFCTTFNNMTETIQENMSALNRVNQALFVSEEKFSKAFHCSSDAIAIVRICDLCFLEINDTFVSKLGYVREKIIGKPSDEFGLWCSSEERKKVIGRIVTTGKVKNTEIQWCYKTGEIRIGLYSGEVFTINGESCILVAWRDITERKEAEQALRQAHDELEIKVEHRTQDLLAMNEELQALNAELQHTLDSLQEMQMQLVQSEKMASLGNLVAGVAHEINTPLGVGVTATSHLQEITQTFKQMYENKKVNRQDLENYLLDCSKATRIVFSNLERASNLVRSFKRISVDQSSEPRRVFNIKQYIEEILLSLHPKLKKTNHTVEVQCDENLKIDGLPGALAQIITNLIINSLMHAYEPNDAGKIIIAVNKNAKEQICLTYTDDGKGIDENLLPKIFDPFFTTNRGSGTGLGLYILYNIVRQQFAGTIKCVSKLKQGTTFIIQWSL